jgi:hypothetical protein
MTGNFVLTWIFPPSQNLQQRHQSSGNASVASGNILESNSFAMLSGDQAVIGGGGQ